MRKNQHPFGLHGLGFEFGFAETEKIVIENLDRFFEGRTVVVVAHRLSTVKFADHLIVMDKGKIVETGSHIDLTYKKGVYYTLVKNQLELGN